MTASDDGGALTQAAPDELLASLVDLKDDRRRRELLLAHDELRGRAAVDRLADQVVHLVRVDLNQAERLAATALWLSEEVGDDYCLGRSQRAVANVAFFKGEVEVATRLYETALECFERVGDQKEIANTRSSGLGNLVFVGDYQRAFEWADVARDIFQSLGDDLRLAALDLNVGMILFRQDRWEEAAARYQAAYEVFRRLGETENVAISLRNMAVCHQSLNNYRQALELYEQARNACEEENLPILVGEIDYNIAYLYYLRGDYTRALELYRTTRNRSEKSGERYHMALCDLDQAEIFLELNLVEEAADLAQRAFASFDELGMPYETAKALANLAFAVNRQGKTFLALELLTKARKIFVQEENQVWPALIDLYEALMMYSAGRPLEAARLAGRAHAGFSRLSLPTKIAMCELLLARVRLENGELDEARKICSAGLERLRHLDVPALRYQVYFVLGQIEEAAGDSDRALEAYRKSQGNLERLRGHLHTEELKVDFLEDKLQVYESLVSLILREEVTFEGKRAAFGCIEKAKTRSLADLMAFRAHALQPRRVARSDQAELVRNLREELNWYYRQIDLQEMRGDDRSREEVAQLREFSQKQEANLLRTLKELQASDEEFSSLQDAATVDIETVRSVVPEDTLLLEYYVARGVVYACILGRDQLEIVPVTVASRAREKLRLLYFQLSKFRLGSEYVGEFLEVINEATHSSLRDLFAELIGPIRGLLSGRQLVVVPHGFLHYVPFHALLDGDRYLLDDVSISYAPSASAYYLSCDKRGARDGGSLVLAGTDVEPSRILEEARAAAAVLPNARLFVGTEAGEEALRAHGRKSRIVYLAAGSSFRRDNPMFSTIQLGGAQLSLFDLYSLRLRAELVVLSGCEMTTSGDGDELVGLTRGLLYAGARSVLVDLWPAGEESKLLLMRSFLTSVGEGFAASEALRQAMQDTRRLYPHPFYWASFILVGSPMSLQPRGQKPTR